MPIVKFTVPADLGGAEEVVVVTWLKRPGDAVQAGEDLVILQAEKVSFDVPAPVTGVIVELVVKQGEVVGVGHLLARLEATEEISPSPNEAPSAEPVEAPSDQPMRASPIAKRLAREHGIDLSAVRGTGEGGRITEKDVQAAIDARTAAPAASAAQEPAPAQPVRASPVAKRMAREHGIDLSAIQGSGSGGRITEKDVQAAIDAGAAPDASVTTELAPAAAVPFVGMRKTIAQRMHASLQESAQLTLHTEADVTELAAHYARLRQSEEISYTDLIVRACALALRRHPAVNVRLADERIERLAEVHVGLAVALDEGLVVPVIRHTDRKSIHEIAQLRRQLAQKARENRLTQEEMSGGTFTVTNLGNYGIDWFTPILNPPEAAILGVGRIIEKVVIHEGKIAQRWRMGLSLTIDHRLIDGAPGAAFLQSIAELLGQPEEL
jgi:pyruvate dehydrogenase E2 component (dihydrolipoamide acetyltransferase)